MRQKLPVALGPAEDLERIALQRGQSLQFPADAQPQHRRARAR